MIEESPKKSPGSSEQAFARRKTPAARRIFVRLAFWQTIASVAGILIAVIALYAALTESSAIRRQTAARVWPYVQLITQDYDAGDKAGFEITFTNAGVGPALMGQLQLAIDARPPTTGRRQLPGWTAIRAARSRATMSITACCARERRSPCSAPRPRRSPAASRPPWPTRESRSFTAIVRSSMPAGSWTAGTISIPRNPSPSARISTGTLTATDSGTCNERQAPACKRFVKCGPTICAFLNGKTENMAIAPGTGPDVRRLCILKTRPG